MAEQEVAEKTVKKTKVEVEVDPLIFARFMRTFDLSNVNGLGRTPQDRIDHMMRLQVIQFEVEEFKRSGQERESERVQHEIQRLKQELGV